MKNPRSFGDSSMTRGQPLENEKVLKEAFPEECVLLEGFAQMRKIKRQITMLKGLYLWQLKCVLY